MITPKKVKLKLSSANPEEIDTASKLIERIDGAMQDNITDAMLKTGFALDFSEWKELSSPKIMQIVIKELNKSGWRTELVIDNSVLYPSKKLRVYPKKWWEI